MRYYHLPTEQRRTQCLVDKFNADEALWRLLHNRRKMRRVLLRQLSREQCQALNLLEFEALHPPDDCVGES